MLRFLLLLFFPEPTHNSHACRLYKQYFHVTKSSTALPVTIGSLPLYKKRQSSEVQGIQLGSNSLLDYLDSRYSTAIIQFAWCLKQWHQKNIKISDIFFQTLHLNESISEEKDCTILTSVFMGSVVGARNSATVICVVSSFHHS